MDEDLNPFEPPQKVDDSNAGPKKLTVVDWVIAIVLGFFAVVMTFFATCFGLGISVAIFADDWLVMACLIFSALFSLACGYLAVRNQLANVKTKHDGTMSSVKRRSFRLSRESSRRSKLGEVLFSCALGMLSLMLILPSLSILSEKLLESQNISPHVADYTQAAVRLFALATSIGIGTFYWFRMSKKD